jgi:AraC-like DNA-binding protein
MKHNFRAAIALEGCDIWRPEFHAESVEVISADARPRGFPLRVSQTLGICVKAGPQHSVRADGRSVLYPPDSVCIRPPGCVWASDAALVAFLSIDIAREWLPETVGGPMVFRGRADLPDLHRIARTLRRTRSPLRAGVVLTELVTAVIDSEALVLPVLRDEALGMRGVRRARDFLTAHAHEPLTLDETARQAGINKFVLVRGFRRTFGITPHAYVVALRVEHARALLSAGMSSVQAGAATGFADQAHFTRWFKRLVGVPPGVYAGRMRSHVSLRSIPFKTVR